jgi:Arc/MetJ-type ribon-helix-helix transcriptional regulator
MISTINISLPKELKILAEKEIKKGFYASFSDLVRSSLRKTLLESELDALLQEAKKEKRQGKGVVLKTDEDIDNYFKTL